MNPRALLAVLGAAFAVLFLLERLFPLRRRTCSVLRRRQDGTPVERDPAELGRDPHRLEP